MRNLQLYFATNRKHEGPKRWKPIGYGNRFSDDGEENPCGDKADGIDPIGAFEPLGVARRLVVFVFAANGDLGAFTVFAFRAEHNNA